MKTSILAAAVLAGAAGFGPAQAQTFPSKVVRIVVPFAPGGAADIMARVLAESMSPGLGQPVIVENRPGGGAVIGYEAAGRAAPDGYTMVSVWPSFVINPAIRKVNYDPIRDFQAVSQTVYLPLALAIQPSIEARTLKELIALAKAKPGTLGYGTPGPGTVQHVVGEMFRLAAGIDITHVPYQGGGAQVAAVAGGHLPMVVSNVTEIAPFARNGKVRVLAVMTDGRSEALPDAPSVGEAGFPDLVVTNWSGMAAPAATPAAAIARLNEELGRVLRKPEVQEKLKAQGMYTAPGRPEQFAALLQSESTRFAKIVREAGVKVD
jgi:tripartite-type tricarboxylate transporter receptor subunit TctC